MRQIRWPLVILGILCAIIWLGCGDDDDDDSNGSNSDTTTVEGGDIVGTWKLVSLEPQVPGAGPLPEQTFTVKSDGTWNSTTVSQIPGLGTFTVTAQGTYKISGDTVTGETTDITMEPDFGVQIPTSTGGFVGESTVKRDGNRLIITTTDATTGQTTTVIYEKQ